MGLGAQGQRRLHRHDGAAQCQFRRPFGPAVEIGWRLARRHWGLGFASEAAWTCLRCAFAQLHLDEVVSFTTEGNLPSQKVMQAIGMVQDLAGSFEHPRLAAGHPCALMCCTASIARGGNRPCVAEWHVMQGANDKPCIICPHESAVEP